MSRYRVTERELLEQVRQEGRMKDIYTMAFDGDKPETIAKKLKLDVATVKKVLGERFTKADFDDNEDLILLAAGSYNVVVEDALTGCKSSHVTSSSYTYLRLRG